MNDFIFFWWLGVTVFIILLIVYVNIRANVLVNITRRRLNRIVEKNKVLAQDHMYIAVLDSTPLIVTWKNILNPFKYKESHFFEPEMMFIHDTGNYFKLEKAA